MKLSTTLALLYRIAKWRLTWDKRNTKHPSPVPENPKFMSPRDAVRLIRDGAVVAGSGLGANQRASIMFWAMRELFEETGHPRDLTFIIIGGHGGRGKIPGTVEELGQAGLVTRFFTGHMETFKSFLRLGDAGKVELQCLPQGTFSLLLDALGRGEDYVENDTGAGTFMDPRVGRGTPLTPKKAPQYVQVVNGRFRYSCPKIDVAVFNAPAVDRRGNIYVKGASMTGESEMIARAARANGGKVIVNTGLLVEEGYDKIFLRAEEVDAVVCYPGTEQTGGVPHRKPLRFLTLGSTTPLEFGVEQVRFVNRLIGVTPKRSAADDALARLAAAIFAENAKRGDRVDIGVGLPEEVARLLNESGLMREVTLMNESGVFGGVMAPGLFFGAAVNPEEIVSSAEAFRRIYDRLDCVILGVLQADSQGNVNVSKRGEGAINYVGPGGFIDLTTCARLIIFCGSWMAHGLVRVENGRMKIVKRGQPKFISEVDEITFNGQEALKRGQKVFYVSHVGAFQLTPRGMELIRVMPGIDIQKDILDAAPMRILLPESGEVPVADTPIITGKGFSLRFP